LLSLAAALAFPLDGRLARAGVVDAQELALCEQPAVQGLEKLGVMMWLGARAFAVLAGITSEQSACTGDHFLYKGELGVDSVGNA
jgi:hypothetical protein